MSAFSRLDACKFQSTRPLRGATPAVLTYTFIIAYFNPRAPCGARPQGGNNMYNRIRISIHAPLAGRDVQLRGHHVQLRDFNPRAPCGARLVFRKFLSWRTTFQSTRPLRGATAHKQVCLVIPIISIHAPLAGRDRKCSGAAAADRNFNPRAPCGARRLNKLLAIMGEEFQSTRPLRGATSYNQER